MKNKERERYSGGQATVPSVCKSPQTLVNFDQTLRPFLPLPSLPLLPPFLSSLSTLSCNCSSSEALCRCCMLLRQGRCPQGTAPSSHATDTHRCFLPQYSPIPSPCRAQPLNPPTPRRAPLLNTCDPTTDGDTHIHTGAHTSPAIAGLLANRG